MFDFTELEQRMHGCTGIVHAVYHKAAPVGQWGALRASLYADPRNKHIVVRNVEDRSQGRGMTYHFVLALSAWASRMGWGVRGLWMPMYDVNQRQLVPC